MGDKETPKKLFQCDLGHVCRLYCSETGRFQNIFSKPGQDKQLKKKRFKATGFRFDDSDTASDVIC